MLVEEDRKAAAAAAALVVHIPGCLLRGDGPTKLEEGISRRSYLGLRTSFCRLRGGDVYLSRLDVIERTLATTAHGGVSLLHESQPTGSKD